MSKQSRLMVVVTLTTVSFTSFGIFMFGLMAGRPLDSFIAFFVAVISSSLLHLLPCAEKE